MKLSWLLIVALGLVQTAAQAPAELPAAAATKFNASLAASKAHKAHVWRDTRPLNEDGTINGYIEIAQGDRRKWELDIARNARAVDRMLPESLGGYPINYGIVPQTVSYDGDPFDILVLGPPIEGGQVVRGLPVGVMVMEDDHILDSKVVVTPVDAKGRPLYELTEPIKQRLADFFNRYKQHIPGALTRVPGWGSREQGVELVRVTHAFFQQCRARNSACTVARPR